MAKKRIESPKNPLVKEALLVRDRRGREAFWAEGPNLLAAALEARGLSRILRVFATGEFMARKAGLVRRLSESGAEMVEVTEGVFKKLSSTEAPQGIAAVSAYTPPALEEIEFGGVTVVLDGIRDPGNLGAIVRTADAFGADCVVLLPGTCDAFSPKALRATAGSVFHLPLIQAEREPLVSVLKRKGVQLVMTGPRGGVGLREADLAPPLAFVFGNEARGISPEVRKAADLAVKIPIMGKAESLNVAASAAVCLYEAAGRE
jgi:TrmH family RNA methyltransferase